MGEFLRLRNTPAGGQSYDEVDDDNPLPIKDVGLGSTLAIGSNGPIPVPTQYNWYFSVAQETKVIKTGVGVLHTISIGKPLGSGVITIYDNTAGSGTLLFRVTFPATLLGGDSFFQLDARFFTGLTIVTSGATQEVLFTYL